MTGRIQNDRLDATKIVIAEGSTRPTLTTSYRAPTEMIGLTKQGMEDVDPPSTPTIELKFVVRSIDSVPIVCVAFEGDMCAEPIEKAQAWMVHHHEQEARLNREWATMHPQSALSLQEKAAQHDRDARWWRDFSLDGGTMYADRSFRGEPFVCISEAGVPLKEAVETVAAWYAVAAGDLRRNAAGVDEREARALGWRAAGYERLSGQWAALAAWTPAPKADAPDVDAVDADAPDVDSHPKP